ncbi:leucine-rich repeat and WD repeat-containing protein 1 isoform X1 [Ascaphus truei]|uniref:leucine-rich repeat and WD repeat-containing protein 1 isoform X1 n=2 Tax=Ascaphus truei TaxID=8439 RepID=UPI003F5A0A02
MTKLTENLLLKKGLPKSSRLKDLKTVNLSKMQLKSEDIDPQLFCQMVKLEELDISHNFLSELPSNLHLHNLLVLNFSDNQVEEVISLKQFPNLEEVMYEENMYLTVSDNYKVFCLLPKLRRLNSKDITSIANHVRFVNHRELSSRVESYWEKNYKDKLPSEPSKEQIKSIGKDFTKSAVEHVRYGPNSLRDFTKWQVQRITENLISSISDSKEKSNKTSLQPSTKDNDGIQALGSPSKRDRDAAADCTKGSPTKRPRILSDIMSMSVSPERSGRLRNSPLKCTPLNSKQNQAVTILEQRGEGKSAAFPEATLKSTPSKTHPRKDRAVSNGKQILPHTDIQNKKALNMEPLHFLQCHSKNNNREDFSTQLWTCAFEPNLDLSSSKVATGGGDSVCIIDCDTGKVLKKYKVTGEEFFTLAWTTLTMVNKDGQKRKFNVLAAGGKRGIVKLIHAKVNLCYGEIKAHKKAISIMCFSPEQETFLFTGSYDKRIILWDIGVPDCEYKFRASQLLTLDTTSTPLRVCLVPACPEQYLLAACEEGCFVWDIKLSKQQGRRSHEIEFQFPIYKKENKDLNFHLIDGLAFLSEDIIASKSVMQGSIYLWSWKKSFKIQKSRSRKILDVAILAELKWSNTELPFITLSTFPERQHVFCGDESGNVWMYNLDSCKAELLKGISSNVLKEPTQILHWPSLTSKKDKVDGTLINIVAVDPALQYLVALTDKNIIAIWKIL